MPKALERKLRKVFKKKGLKGEDLNHAIYGTMTNMGWRRGKKGMMKGGKKK